MPIPRSVSSRELSSQTSCSSPCRLDISLPSVMPVQSKRVARLHRMPMALPIRTQQMLRHKLTWHQLQHHQHSTHFHTRFTLRAPQAAALTRQQWKPVQSTQEMLLLDQEVKAASQSGVSDLQSPRVHRLGQMVAMVSTRPMRLSQAMGTTQSMGIMLTMSWGLYMARPKSRLCTGRQSRMIRALA